MTKYLITATRTTVYEMEVEADSPQEAHVNLDDWIVDDFESFITNQSWDFEIEEN